METLLISPIAEAEKINSNSYENLFGTRSLSLSRSRKMGIACQSVARHQQLREQLLDSEYKNK